ncbi:MAG: hypothetical protein H6581_27890 [Bacteroidia bacterium]|nr:hypothetical protein [Bacteroidia bacterium]
MVLISKYFPSIKNSKLKSHNKLILAGVTPREAQSLPSLQNITADFYDPENKIAKYGFYLSAPLYVQTKDHKVVSVTYTDATNIDKIIDQAREYSLAAL